MCIKLKPEWAKGYYRYGNTLMFMEKYEESVEYFRTANKLEPNNAEIHRCLKEAEGLEYNQRATLANTMGKKKYIYIYLGIFVSFVSFCFFSIGQPIPKAPIRRQQIKAAEFNPELFGRAISVNDEWYTSSETSQGLAAFMR